MTDTVTPFSKTKTSRQPIRFLLVLAVLMTAAFTGCQYTQVKPQITSPGPVELAQQAFLNGDYVLARELFNALVSDNDHPEYAGARVYGLACIDMATAKSKEAFLKAFETVSLGDGVGFKDENPRLLIKALTHGMALVKAHNMQARHKIKTMKKKEKTLNKTITTLQGQVETLKDQISALESIDKDFQKKRKKQ